MSRATTKTTHELTPTTYAKLIARFPLRPLHDEVDYENALEAAELLVGLPDMTEDQADYLDVLTDIIQKYEAAHHAISSRATPLTTLKHFLAERGMSGSDLGRLLGSRPLGAAILRGERQLSKTHVRKLAHEFRVSTDLFLGTK
jgi:HTH-type transcriptional regulator/antitoxin HigA